MIDCLRSFCLVMSRGLAHLATLSLSIMLRYVIIKPVVLLGLIGMHKTGCSEDLFCTYVAHHELESAVIFIIVSTSIIIIIISTP